MHIEDIQTLFWIHLIFQLHPTEPANYTGSYTTFMKEIVDIEIAMHQSSRPILVTSTQNLSLLKLTVSKEREGRGLRT
jgi:hypothetical protein